MENYQRIFSVPVIGISLFLQILKAFQERGDMINDAKIIYDFSLDKFIAEIWFHYHEDYTLFYNVVVSACSSVKTGE